MISSALFTLPKLLNFNEYEGAKNLITKLNETEAKLEVTYDKQGYSYNIMPVERISFLALKYGATGGIRKEYNFIK